MGMNPLRIEQLPLSVANQIAAGEVIERPASVVKELLENALDARADVIGIDIGYGGLNQIKVSDNGLGIVAEDLPLAIAAHATSKLKQLNDLYNISSMGFRGEALASIAAVSRLTLSSKPDNQIHAMMMRSDGTIMPCARNKGTTVEVLDLFFNAPVRKKFLKTPRGEYQAIEMVVKRFALSAPHVALTLRHDEKPILTLVPACCDKTKLFRIKALLGKPFIDNAIQMDVKQGELQLEGWISAPTYQRSQNDKQWIYINQRMVKDKLIQHAIKQAYEGLLDPGRYPTCVLYLTLPACELDVNVHPTKHEVRFQQPRLIHDFILTHLRHALSINLPNKVKPTVSSPQRSSTIEPFEEFTQQPFKIIPSKQADRPDPWFILNNKFVMMRIEEQPYLVDIEQVYHQWLLSVLREEPLPLRGRPLLVPVTFPIDKADFQRIEQYQLLLMELGIHMDWISHEKVVIRTIPCLLPQLDLKQLLMSIKGVDLDLATLMGGLVSCQTFNVSHLQSEDKERLEKFIQDQQADLNWVKPSCLPMNLETCCHLLRQKK